MKTGMRAAPYTELCAHFLPGKGTPLIDCAQGILNHTEPSVFPRTYGTPRVRQTFSPTGNRCTILFIYRTCTVPIPVVLESLLDCHHAHAISTNQITDQSNFLCILCPVLDHLSYWLWIYLCLFGGGTTRQEKTTLICCPKCSEQAVFGEPCLFTLATFLPSPKAYKNKNSLIACNLRIAPLPLPLSPSPSPSLLLSLSLSPPPPASGVIGEARWIPRHIGARPLTSIKTLGM